MPKLKKKLTGNFTIINNTVLRDKRNVLMMDRWTDICRKKKYIPKW